MAVLGNTVRLLHLRHHLIDQRLGEVLAVFSMTPGPFMPPRPPPATISGAPYPSVFTMIIGLPLPCAMRLSRITLALPTVSQPDASSPRPWSRYSTGYNSLRAGS